MILVQQLLHPKLEKLVCPIKKIFLNGNLKIVTGYAVRQRQVQLKD